MQLISIVESPIGTIGIKLQDSAITEIVLLPEDLTTCKQDGVKPVIKALKDYFSNPHATFALPLQPAGTDFQKRVWRALCDIPAGTTLTYGQLASKLKTSARAVGQACRRNPIPIIIPCHRVTSATGPGGYMGESSGALADIKQWLLRHESR